MVFYVVVWWDGMGVGFCYELELLSYLRVGPSPAQPLSQCWLKAQNCPRRFVWTERAAWAGFGSETRIWDLKSTSRNISHSVRMSLRPGIIKLYIRNIRAGVGAEHIDGG